MNLKKNKKLKKKYDTFKVEYKQRVAFHVYRSEDKNAPFSEWTRLTDEPVTNNKFSDRTLEPGKFYFYKMTNVDANGVEGKPYDPPKGYYSDEDGTPKPDHNPLNDVVGYNIYRSIDRSLPPDQWERRNPELLPTTGFEDKGIESGVTYYYYVTAVNAAGAESEPSEIISIVGK